MNNSRRYLTLAALLVFSGFSAAAAGPVTPGDYKLALKNGAPCTLTLASNGAANAGSCANAPVSHWRQTGSTLELDQGTAVFAVLQANADGYAGKTIESNASLTLTPASETAAISH